MGTRPNVSRRTFLQYAGLAAAGATLAACAPATPQVVKETVVVEGTPKVVEKVVTAAPSAVPAGLEGKKGILWGLQYDPHVEAYKRLAALFHEKTGATVEVHPQPWPIETKLVAALAANNQPDVVCIMPCSAFSLIVQKLLMDVGEKVFDPLGIDPHKIFTSVCIDSWMWREHFYGVPVESWGVGAQVAVPTDYVEAKGLGDKYPPTNGKDVFDSYEQMWELAQALMIKEGDKVKRWGLSSQGGGSEAAVFLSNLLGLYSESGKEVFDPETGKFNIDTDEGITAMELIVETPVKMGIERQLDKSGIDAALAGEVAVVLGNCTPCSKEGYDLGYHFEGVAPPPARPGKTPIYFDMGSWSFVAPAGAKNPDISVAFLKMMCTTEGQREYCRIYGGQWQPAWLEFMGKFDHFDNPDPNSPMIKSAMRNQRFTLPKTRTFGIEGFAPATLAMAASAAFSNVREGKMTSKEGVKVLQAEVDAKYKQFQDDIKTQQYG